MRSPTEIPTLALEVDTIGLQNGAHPLEIRHLSLAEEASRRLPGDAPRLTVGFANGFVESSKTVELAAAALIGIGAAHGQRVDTFSVNAPQSYGQEQHTDDARTAFAEISKRNDGNSALVGVGHSRGDITLTEVHHDMPEAIGFTLNIAPPACNPLRISHKGAVTAVMALRMLKEARITSSHMLKDWPSLRYALPVMGSLGSNGLRHFFKDGVKSISAATDEIQEIVQSEKYRYMERLVDLHTLTQATGVVICSKDALCTPQQSAQNLRTAGYTGPIHRFPQASHIDPLSQPKRYAPKVFELLQMGLSQTTTRGYDNTASTLAS